MFEGCMIRAHWANKKDLRLKGTGSQSVIDSLAAQFIENLEDIFKKQRMLYGEPLGQMSRDFARNGNIPSSS